MTVRLLESVKFTMQGMLKSKAGSHVSLGPRLFHPNLVFLFGCFFPEDEVHLLVVNGEQKNA